MLIKPTKPKDAERRIKMTKENYIKLAAIIKNVVTQNKIKNNNLAPIIAIAQDIAGYCASDNPRFNWDKFITACNIEVKE